MAFIPDALSFLEDLGFRFHLDWDESLLILPPENLTGEDVLEEFGKHQDAAVLVLKARHCRRMQVCFGGPFNGRRHRYEAPLDQGRWFGIRVERARWAAYKVSEDNRAFFQGYASSENKARRRILISEKELS